MTALSTKEKLIKETARLVRTKGYFGAGLKEILHNSGVPKGSLYHHFPGGKDSLVVAALRYASGRMLASYQDAMRGTKTPLAGLSVILDVLADDLEKSDFQHGCPLATVALESSGTSAEIRKSLAEMYQAWEDALAGYLALKQISESRRKARLFLTLLEGGFLLAKAHGNATFLRKIKGDLETILPG